MNQLFKRAQNYVWFSCSITAYAKHSGVLVQ